MLFIFVIKFFNEIHDGKDGLETYFSNDRQRHLAGIRKSICISDTLPGSTQKTTFLLSVKKYSRGIRDTFKESKKKARLGKLEKKAEGIRERTLKMRFRASLQSIISKINKTVPSDFKKYFLP